MMSYIHREEMLESEKKKNNGLLKIGDRVEWVYVKVLTMEPRMGTVIESIEPRYWERTRYHTVKWDDGHISNCSRHRLILHENKNVERDTKIYVKLYENPIDPHVLEIPRVPLNPRNDGTDDVFPPHVLEIPRSRLMVKELRKEESASEAQIPPHVLNFIERVQSFCLAHDDAGSMNIFKESQEILFPNKALTPSNDAVKEVLQRWRHGYGYDSYNEDDVELYQRAVEEMKA